MGKRWKQGWVLPALAMAVCWIGCSQADTVKAANAIHVYVPTIRALANDAALVAEALDAADAGGVKAVSAKVQTELAELDALSTEYAGAPSGDGWTRLCAAVDTMVNDADEGLLTAVAIKNPESQAKAKVALSALDAAVHVVDGYVMAARSPDDAKAAAAKRAGKVKWAVRYWNNADWQRVEQAFGSEVRKMAGAEMRLGF